jgi:hypothetical protein
MLTTIRRKLRDDNGPTDKLGAPETALEYNGGYIPTAWLPPPLLPRQVEVCATIIPVDSATPPCAFVFGAEQAEIDAALKLWREVINLISEWIANGKSGYSLPVIRGELLDQLVAQAEAGDVRDGRADSPAAPLPAEAATNEIDAALKLWREVKAMPKIGTMMVQVTKSEFRNVQCYWESPSFFTIFEGGDGVTLNRNEARQIALRILANNSERMVGDGRKPTPGRDQRDATG